MKKSNYLKLSFKRLGRTVKKSPFQFLAMVLILTLATTLFTGFYASYLELDYRITDYYEKSNMADIWTTTYSDSSDFGPEEMERDRKDIIDASKDYGGIVESRYYSQAKINGQNNYICLSDSYPTISHPYETNNTEKENFLIIDKRFYEEGKTKSVQIQVSIANLKLDTYIKEILNTHLKEGKSNIFNKDYLIITADVTGQMIHPESILYSDNVTSPIFLMSRSYLNSLLVSTIADTFNNWELPLSPSKSEQIAYDLVHNSKSSVSDKCWYDNQYLTRLKNRGNASAVKEIISNKFASRPNKDNDLLLNVDLANLESNKNITMDLIQSRQMCFAFPAIFFLVAILVVSTTISQIILKERNEIGTLRALGASSKSIALHYLILECLVGLVGVVVGIILGPLILPVIMDAKYAAIYMLPARSFVFPTAAAIIIVIIVLAAIALVSFFTAHKEAKQMPCVSMRPKAIKKSKFFAKSAIVKEKNKTHKLCFKMAIRNIFISSTRSIMVILGVLGCTGLLCCGFGIDDAINYGVDHDMNCYFNADAMVYFSSGGQETVDAIEQLVTDKLITKYEPVSILPTTCYKVGMDDSAFTTQIYSLDTYTYKQNQFINTGEFDVHNTNVAITSKVAKALNVTIGDFINFSFLGKNYKGTVGAVLDSFYVQGVIIDGRWPSYPDCLTAPTVFVRCYPGADLDVVVQRLKAIEGVSEVMKYSEMVSHNSEVVGSLHAITLVIKLFAILLAAVVLYNLALLNFKENMRNVATMKVLGFTRREIAESLVMEIMLLTILGVILGLAIGFPLEILILSINKTPMNEFIYYIAPQTFIYSFLITIFVAFAINIYLSLKSKKVKMVESLKSVE